MYPPMPPPGAPKPAFKQLPPGFTFSSNKKRRIDPEDETDPVAKAAKALAARLAEEREENLKIHREIASNLSVCVSVGSGEHKHEFMLPKELLTLHCGYFEDYYSNADEDQKPPSFPELDARCFLQFATWLTTGEWYKLPSHKNYPHPPPNISLWEIGKTLHTPALLNALMDKYRPLCRGVLVGSIGFVYDTHPKDSNLRKLMAHTTARLGPIQSYAKGSMEHTRWQKLLQEVPGLALDMAELAGKEWNGTWPGDDMYRSEYMEIDIPLAEKWKRKILEARNIEEIKAKAEEGCVWSIVELDHIERNK